MSAALAGTAGRRFALLDCGIVAGPLFAGAVLVQAAARPGFDPSRHPLSLLALGPHGWVQVSAFVLTGLLAIAGAVGVRRALHSGPAGTWGPLLYGLFGVAMIASGVLPADPYNGYPAQEAETITWHGVAHDSAATVSGIAVLAASLVFARRYAKLRRRGWMAYCLTVPVLDLALSGAAGAASDFRLLLLAGIVDWTFLAVIAVQLRGNAK
ncbi:DUF998 domain-containing protein [Micromonospora sp. NPDC047548]|uniref:DUF998 domain-containing protein n=1 Tax=Micromonospora sp. NPDC047548 TaxID=3155624 RepID=UPI003406099E